MKSVTDIACLTFNATVTVAIFMCFWKQLFEPHQKRLLFHVIAFIICAADMVLIGTLGIPLLNTAAFSSHMIGTCWLLYDKNIRRTMPYNFLLIASLIVADVMSLMIGSLVFRKTPQAVIDSPYSSLVFCFVYVIMSFVIYRICLLFVKKSAVSSIRTIESAALCIMSLFEYFSAYTLAESADDKRDVLHICFVLAGFALFNFFIAYTMQRIGDLYQQSIQLDAMKKQNEIQLAYYTSLNEKYQQSRKVIHDMKKHVSALSALRETDSERAEQYSAKLQSEMDSLFCGFHCTNQILSIVMSQKITEAETEVIKVHTKVEDIAFDFIADYDLIAIFANLWDNAIEACKVIDGERFIRVTVKKINGFATISFENSFDGKYRIKEGKLHSTKAEHEGLGMTIIETAVQKHGGIMVTDGKNNIFTTEITIPIPQQK